MKDAKSTEDKWPASAWALILLVSANWLTSSPELMRPETPAIRQAVSTAILMLYLGYQIGVLVRAAKAAKASKASK